MSLRRALPLLLLLAAAGCRTPRTPHQVDALIRQALDAAALHEEAGQPVEAAVMARAVYYIDAEQPEVRRILANEPAEFFDRGLLGSNARLRDERDASVLRHILLYLPDRILDAFDILSFDVHAGLGVFLDVHVTRAATVALGTRTVAGVGWHFDRSLGVQSQAQAAFWLVGGGEGYAGTRVGTSGVSAGTWSVGGLAVPRDRLYQEYRDYWAVGAAATAGVVGVDVDVHLFQILDFFAGIALFDPARDDFATTRGLDLSTNDERLLQELGVVAADGDEVREYLQWRADELEAARSAGEGAAGAP